MNSLVFFFYASRLANLLWWSAFTELSTREEITRITQTLSCYNTIHRSISKYTFSCEKINDRWLSHKDFVFWSFGAIYFLQNCPLSWKAKFTMSCSDFGNNRDPSKRGEFNRISSIRPSINNCLWKKVNSGLWLLRGRTFNGLQPATMNISGAGKEW